MVGVDRGKAADIPKIYVDPYLSTGASGGDFTVGIKVADIASEESLYAWEFHLKFDPSILSAMRTRYFRSDIHSVNQHTNRTLLTVQSGTADSVTRSASGTKTYYETGIRVWKVYDNGAETEITGGSPQSVARQLLTKNSIVKGAPWACPSASLQPTDAILVRVYGKFMGESVWTLLDGWITEPLGVQRLDSATWTVHYYIHSYLSSGITYGKLYFDNATCNSRIEISSIVRGSFLSDAASPDWSTSSYMELNNTEGTIRMYEVIQANPSDPKYPPIGAVGSGTLATIKFFIKTEGISSLHFDYSELDTIIADTTVSITHDAVDGLFKSPLLHDIAVTNVTAFPLEAIKPAPIVINVTAANQGDFTENFNVTAYYDTNPIKTWTSLTLEPETNMNLTYTWDTTFVSVGTHTIWAKATEVPGEPDTTDNEYTDGTVTISNPPEAPTGNFTYSPKKPLVLETITFNASDSTPGTGHIVSYKWNFSDGTIQTFIKDANLTAITTHAYTQTGIYTVRLTVENNETLTDSVETTIRIIQNPVAIFSHLPVNPIIEENTTFNASASHDNFDSGTIVNYEWDFNYDGITFESETTDKVVTHSFSSIGTYTVALKVTDNDGLTDVATDDITVLLHDIAIINIAVSNTSAKIGESISITVTVKNEGNFSETFDTKVYYNENLIETKPVSELAEKATKILVVNWNTTGVAEGEHTIKASASIVEGERQTYTTDNTYAYGKITLTSEETPPPPPPPSTTSPPSSIYLYAAAGAIIIILAGAAIYFTKIRRKP